jgi:histidine triad (HIT) family protein
MLVIPNRHAPTILDLSEEEISEVYRHARGLVVAICDAFDPKGFNIFQNNGVAANQTVPHFHLHIVPRYGDDDPGTIFGEKGHPLIPDVQRIELAEEIRKHL